VRLGLAGIGEGDGARCTGIGDGLDETGTGEAAMEDVGATPLEHAAANHSDAALRPIRNTARRQCQFRLSVI